MNRTPLVLLYLNVLVIATCGLIYELLAGTLASYVLGDSVTQFSLVIGVYLSAMGVGAWLSGLLVGNLARRFIEGRSQVATALMRQMMYRNSAQPDPVLAHQVESLAMFYASIGDGKEGVAAFLEKRPAKFGGHASSDMPPFYPW